MEPIRTVICQKSPVLRSQLADFLAEAGISDVTLACSLPGLREKATKCKPHLILLDIYLMDDDCRALLQGLRQEMPQVKVVLTGPEPEAYYAKHIATMGADLYLSDGLQPDEWIKRLQSVTIIPR